jgi:hypothetical protein
MQQFSAISWLVKCALMAAAVLLADRLATMAIGTKLQQPAITARDGSLITLNRYMQEPTPAVVMVGSSVTWRLKEEYFEVARIRNLALAGGSPVTGLEIVAGQNRLPKVVLIETNVLSRLADPTLVARFTGKDHSETFLRPVRTAVAAYELWNHAPPDPGRVRATLEGMLREPPSSFDSRVYVARLAEQMNTEDLAAAARANVAVIRQRIAEIERRGAKALLMHVPLPPEIEETRSAKVAREIVREGIPDAKAWLTIDAPLAELRWADGMHLDERSALIVARAVEKALAGL